MKKLFLLLTLLPLIAASAHACPGCKEGVTLGTEAGQPATVLAGFSLSVMVLLAAVSGVGVVLWRTVLKAVRESEAAWKQKSE
ncbi:hypothetical protein SAMN05444156_1071 [Verrucomicrobium sp. GAS474]|uniref:hypothetical protein n=1 Tax=Verrucomicrobium sp. GAS474 TaxID=1882831 RepID=UPI000879BAF1|nr:hypothetical protein [Verrucomicrobium sp. GAS474]SDT95936.1 hypothetical protein SAMN05444156_1071 [Verrucomicrobium sp. GAS474]